MRGAHKRRDAFVFPATASEKISLPPKFYQTFDNDDKSKTQVSLIDCGVGRTLLVGGISGDDPIVSFYQARWYHSVEGVLT